MEKSLEFYAVTPCSSEKTQYFRGMYLLCLQVRRASQAGFSWFLARLPFTLKIEAQYILLKCHVFSEVHDITTQRSLLLETKMQQILELHKRWRISWVAE
jgi:hypothetical protein